MQYNYIFVDTNNLYWRCVYFVVKSNLQNITQQNFSLIIQECLNQINILQNKFAYNNTQFYFLHDNPFSKINERELIDPTYKHARKNKNIPPIFYKTLDKFIDILRYMSNNYYICFCSGYEADDLVLPLLQYIKCDTDERILLVSNDLDWARGILENCHWYNYTNVFDVSTFLINYRFVPSLSSVLMYKTIHGDNSDCIDNAVPYLPEDILLHIVMHYSSLDDLLKNMWNDTVIPQQWKLKIKESEVQLKINWQLVNYLPLSCNIKECITQCNKDISRLKYLFSLYDLEYSNEMVTSEEFFSRKKYKRNIAN